MTGIASTVKTRRAGYPDHRRRGRIDRAAAQSISEASGAPPSVVEMEQAGRAARLELSHQAEQDPRSQAVHGEGQGKVCRPVSRTSGRAPSVPNARSSGSAARTK